jgi:hypothetical protein
VLAVAAQELGAIKVGAVRAHPAAAAVAELINFHRVQLHGDPDPAMRTAHELDLLGHTVADIVKDPGAGAVLGELPFGGRAGEVLPIVIHDHHFDRDSIIHGRECRSRCCPAVVLVRVLER